MVEGSSGFVILEAMALAIATPCATVGDMMGRQRLGCLGAHERFMY